ncbi:MAG: FkbM family methyltransferase [Nitrosomonas sp.]|nr:FkbM family methyltransferase [Nitrosomonas sp.]
MSMKDILKHMANMAGFELARRGGVHSTIDSHLASLFKKYAIDCVIDVGANTGQYGEFLRSIGYRGWIFSFEPVKAVFDQLIDRAKGDDKWICKNIALGDKAEKKEINVYSSSVFSSFLDANTYSKNIWKSLESVVSEEVTIARLDDIFLTEIHERTGGLNYYLKLDTQGYDLNVFYGGLETLDKICAMQTELSLIHVYENMPDPYEALNVFHSKNYCISGMYPINRDESLAVIEYDCILVKRSTQIDD